MKITGLDNVNAESLPKDWSETFEYKENLDRLRSALKDFEKYSHIIVIGNGGSITSFEAYYRALNPNKKVFILSTMEPRFLEEVVKNYPEEKTLVIPVSKSGNTLGMVESLLNFVGNKDQDGYKILAVTNTKSGALLELAKKRNWPVIEHPEIGGRFSGGTTAALVPSYLCGFDIGKITEGIQSGYQLKNEAYALSKKLYDLEQDAVSEVFVPIYSYYLMGFQNLIVQLMHESVCKDSQGQTYYAALAPESQHHTNQRFFGGKRNVTAIFIIYKGSNNLEMSVPEDFKDINIRSEELKIVDKIKYRDALFAEYIGTKTDADNKKIPNFTIELEEINETEIGKFLGFWHLMAFYSALLRGVVPFGQPAVEDSKEITVQTIKKLSR